MKTNDATHNTTSIARRYVAVGKEIPMPVARATYTATHAGHLGSNASVTLGTIQPAISPPRRNRDAGRRTLSRSRIAVWQQRRDVLADDSQTMPEPLGEAATHDCDPGSVADVPPFTSSSQLSFVAPRNMKSCNNWMPCVTGSAYEAIRSGVTN